MSTYFITGIDTDAGKTFATGLMAKYLLNKKVNVMTQKFAQTGCVGISEDILAHRDIMGVKPYDVDKDGTTCPYVFTYPASPHLAAKIDGQEIDMDVINASTKQLQDQYETLLIEGVGGLHVPITLEYSLLDYLEEKKHPLILITSSKLGSINHTLMTLELAYHRKLPIQGLIYNHYPNNSDLILEDSIEVFRTYLSKFGYKCPIVEIPEFKIGESPYVDFSPLFQV
ncbi:dethiobiotin synthase [Ancylomarina subtilis]|uniref:ATP-dependent dethiobiotin synthetase BioD n=1 Tax=Ancylomarina subtilis TaxID=1639035 RepID=A0A4Q7VHZ3_9BACT|nr:dethiobiotin synthase [Ancylomarina subtilis]RZT95723.1 dethiobiotin synthase [Ancylomarina subtilis]